MSNLFGQRPFSAEERAHISSTLRKAVGPEYLSQRAGPGGSKLVYISGSRVISLANEIFGFDGWSHSIVSTEIDFVDTSRDGTSVSLGISTVVRVTLRDGTSHEDVGYGSIENARSKGAAFDKAKKESVTDAIKRALRSFGNVMGNCTYNNELAQRIFKMQKLPAGPIEMKDLYRGEEFAAAAAKAQALTNNSNGSTSNNNVSKVSGGGSAGGSVGNGNTMDLVAKFDDDDDLVFGDVETLDTAYLTRGPPTMSNSSVQKPTAQSSNNASSNFNNNGSSSAVFAKPLPLSTQNQLHAPMPLNSGMVRPAPMNRPASAPIQSPTLNRTANRTPQQPPSSFSLQQQQQARSITSPTTSANRNQIMQVDQPQQPPPPVFGMGNTAHKQQPPLGAKPLGQQNHQGNNVPLVSGSSSVVGNTQGQPKSFQGQLQPRPPTNTMAQQQPPVLKPTMNPPSVNNTNNGGRIQLPQPQQNPHGSTSYAGLAVQNLQQQQNQQQQQQQQHGFKRPLSSDSIANQNQNLGSSTTGMNGQGVIVGGPPGMARSGTGAGNTGQGMNSGNGNGVGLNAGVGNGNAGNYQYASTVVKKQKM